MKKVQLAADDPSQTWTGAELHVLQMNNISKIVEMKNIHMSESQCFS